MGSFCRQTIVWPDDDLIEGRNRNIHQLKLNFYVLRLRELWLYMVRKS
jgi:hypothetical protein